MLTKNEQLSLRIQEIRRETFGDEGVSALSTALGLPARTWENYENGVVIPAWIILQFIELTGVEPNWLMAGEGERYRDRPAKSIMSTSR